MTIAESLTLTAGISDDWDPRFDDMSVVTNRVKYRKATAGGEFQYNHIGTSTGKRFKIAWDSDAPSTVIAHLSGYPAFTGTGGYIQVKLNGEMYEYDFSSPTDYFLSLEVKEGRNQLVISCEYGPWFPMFEAMLFDGVTSRFVDPSTEHGYVKE